MLSIDLNTLLALAGLSFLTASCAAGGLILVSGNPKKRKSRETPSNSSEQFSSFSTEALESNAEFDRQELVVLQESLASTPTLIWQRNEDGTLRWANAAYAKLVSSIKPDAAQTWPLPDLFAEFLPQGLVEAPIQRRASLERTRFGRFLV